MHWSFGIESCPPSMRWEDIIKGPSKEAVRAHVNKIGRYNELRTADGGALVRIDPLRLGPVASGRVSDPGLSSGTHRKAA
jgi:hypothetical protein